jgi:hypothetical protein
MYCGSDMYHSLATNNNAKKGSHVASSVGHVVYVHQTSSAQNTASIQEVKYTQPNPMLSRRKCPTDPTPT